VPLEGAVVFAERQRVALEARPVLLTDGSRIPLTVSIGVAAYAAVDRSPADLVAAADRALYEAKNAGRNRVAAAKR
jgi:two-component system cell cycle response regulator